jgi:hypothetical protein
LHPETSWEATLTELEADRFPALDRIGRALRYGDAPVPRSVREFLARFLLGEVKRPHGRPKADVYESRLKAVMIDLYYSAEHELAKAEKRDWDRSGTPSELATERVAEKMKMSPASVRDVLHRQNGWEDV